MNTSATKKFWLRLEITAAALLLIGAVLNLSGSMRIGGLLMAVGVPLVGGAALKLGHLKLW